MQLNVECKKKSQSTPIVVILWLKLWNHAKAHISPHTRISATHTHSRACCTYARLPKPHRCSVRRGRRMSFSSTSVRIRPHWRWQCIIAATWRQRWDMFLLFLLLLLLHLLHGRCLESRFGRWKKKKSVLLWLLLVDFVITESAFISLIWMHFQLQLLLFILL